MGRQTKKDHRTSSLTRKQGTRNVKQSFLIVCEEYVQNQTTLRLSV